jgi:8-oxo-dGTP pyrophosphatase MutT (NUDIX family)
MTSVASRRSARVLLVDGRHRLLLFRFQTPAHWAVPHFWATPGGGVQDGESLPAAAARELREEIGLHVAEDRLGPVVACSSGPAEFGDRILDATDSFFFLRIGTHTIDTSGQEDGERAYMSGYRWWTLPELAATDELVFPINLTDLLPGLIAGELPAEPVRLPWRHGE